MNTIHKSIFAAALLLGTSQAALAQNAAAAAPAISSPAIAGIGVANADAVVANANAFRTAVQQRPVTYKAQITAAEARRAQISAQLQPMVERFNRESQAANASTPAAQTSLQQQAQAIQRIQQSGQQELQRMLEPVALSEAYVQEQIGDKLNAAIQAAMVKKKVSLVLAPQSVLAASGSYNLNQAILDELNVTIPSAQLVPPAGWEPREAREARAQQAAQQRPAGAAQTPGKPQPGGR